MLKTIKITNYLGESLTMELAHPEKSGLAITGVTGLNPPKATINSTELSSSDGSVYNSANVTSRNIVMTLRLLFNDSVEDSRQKIYKYFPIKKKLRIEIESSNRHCYTYGYVESNEINLFTKEESSQISIVCPDPYLYSIDEHMILFSSIIKKFEFPFSNESLTEKTIMFSKLSTSFTKTFYYLGDVPAGMIITMHSLGDACNPVIYSDDTGEFIKIDTDKMHSITGSNVKKGDDLIISTVNGDKYAKLLRDGQYTNILNCLDQESTWMKFTKGDNIISLYAEYGASNLQLIVSSRTVYEGV